MPLIQFLSFKIFGLSLVTLRLPAILCSVLLLGLMLYLLFIRAKNKLSIPLLLTFFLFVFNNYNFNYARAGRIEMPMLAFSVLLFSVIYFFTQNKKPNFLKLPLITVLAILAMLTRPTALIIIFAILAWLGIQWAQEKNRFKKQNYFLLGVAALAGVLISFLILKILPFLFQYTQNYEALDVVGGNMIFSWQNFFNYFKFLGNSLVQDNFLFLVIAWVQALRILFHTVVKKIKIASLDVFFALFFVIYFLFVGWYDYMPPRWVIPVLIPAFYLAALFPEWLGTIKLKGFFKKWHLQAGGIILVIILNLNNVSSMINYFSDLRFTKRDVASLIKKDIQKDLNRKDISNVVLYGTHSSTFSVTNHMPFKYQIPKTPGQYVVLHSEGDVSAKRLKLIGEYDMLYNYGDLKVHLYKTY